MNMNYCSKCGLKLSLKEVGDEGIVPYCTECKKAYLKFPRPCILVALINEFNEIALLKQNYMSKEFRGLVSGYIKEEETAEESAIREVKEETGLEIDELIYIKSYISIQKNLLMFAYLGQVQKKDFNMSIEVDDIGWFKLSEVEKYMKPGSIGLKHVLHIINSKRV